jgi:hypothetical protein
MAEILLPNGQANHFDEELNGLGGPYDKWLADMASRPGAVLVPIPFDPAKYPEQKFEVPDLDASDPYSYLPDRLYYLAFKYKWAKALGGVAVWNALSEQMANAPVSPNTGQPILNRTNELMADGKNIIVITSHFSFEELGYLKALRYHLRKDRAKMDKMGTVLNKLMTRQSYHGKPVPRQFSACGKVYFSYPKTATAQRHGVPDNIVAAGNLKMLRALRADLKRSPGREIDIVLTGKQIVPNFAIDTSGVSYYEIPSIDPSSAALVEAFDYAYGATLIESPVTGEWQMAIGQLIDIKDFLKTNDVGNLVDQIYLPIRQSVESFTGTPTVYNKMGKQAIAITQTV